MVIKICGLRSIVHARAAAAAGVDLIGLVFAPSRRQIRVDEARVIADDLRALKQRRPLIVGLFVNAVPDEIRTIAAEVGLDAVQLSGDEPAAHSDAFDLPLLKAVRLSGTPEEQAWIERIRAVGAKNRSGSSAPDLEYGSTREPHVLQRLPVLSALVDAHVPGAYGGTGMQADWGRAAALAVEMPIMLAGGLHPGNVAAAIAAVHPWGVDVSSGVETDGVKDPERIEAFVTIARKAFGREADNERGRADG